MEFELIPNEKEILSKINFILEQEQEQEIQDNDYIKNIKNFFVVNGKIYL